MLYTHYYIWYTQNTIIVIHTLLHMLYSKYYTCYTHTTIYVIHTLLYMSYTHYYIYYTHTTENVIHTLLYTLYTHRQSTKHTLKETCTYYIYYKYVRYSAFCGRRDSKWSSECKTRVRGCIRIHKMSSEDETRNGHLNAKRNPNGNHEAIVLGLFSFAILERDVEWQFLDSD